MLGPEILFANEGLLPYMNTSVKSRQLKECDRVPLFPVCNVCVVRFHVLLNLSVVVVFNK